VTSGREERLKSSHVVFQWNAGTRTLRFQWLYTFTRTSVFKNESF